MHEAGYTEEIVRVIVEEIRTIPDLIVKKIRVSIGEMLHLEPESVREHFRHLAEGTGFEDASLEFSEAPVKVRCGLCAQEGGVEDHHLLICSYCGSKKVTLLGGDEISVDSIEGEAAWNG
jgi:hydrogenase nickel incorporation protein HypA/HybF